MPSRKRREKPKLESSSVRQHDDEGDASSISSSDTVCSAPQREASCANACRKLDVIQKLDLMRSDFSTKLDGVLNAIQDVKKDIRDFSGRMDLAEERISNVEDAVNSEKNKLEDATKHIASLTRKLDDLENLRLLNLPEKVENPDAVAFLEKWLPVALGPETFPTPPIIERAHRLVGHNPVDLLLGC